MRPRADRSRGSSRTDTCVYAEGDGFRHDRSNRIAGILDARQSWRLCGSGRIRRIAGGEDPHRLGDHAGPGAEARGIRKETCDPDPDQWYRNTFGKEAEYSELLDALCRTAAERQQLLRGYIEPSADDREEGAKQPTAGHRAIAVLAAEGFIRVILTTNFDRLNRDGVGRRWCDSDSADHAGSTAGRCRWFTRTAVSSSCTATTWTPGLRNTQAELDSYPAEFNRLLDQVFDEFGLVVCGWSAAWDGALRKALNRGSSRPVHDILGGPRRR